ncbi:MAG TPA: helix-turn-helix transcriptional regulator [Chitinophagaceae bacterium]|nr:helix-turn-helix transcriptional regulator [Chitinophagaceae bacterium]
MSNHFGFRIRQLREHNNLLLRQVAPFIDIDTPLLSKIERGERVLKKEQIPLLAKILKTDEDELMTLWLADQMYNVIDGEPLANEAIKQLTKNIKKP